MAAVLSDRETETLVCDDCGFKANTERGLKRHKTMEAKRKEKEEEETETETEMEEVAQVDSPEETSEKPVKDVMDAMLPVTPPVDEEETEEVSEETEEVPEEDPPEGIPETEPPMAAPEPLDPKSLGIREILVGSKLRLDGPHYVLRRSEDGNTFSIDPNAERAEGVLVQVVSRWKDQNENWCLTVLSVGGTQEWVLFEANVFEGKDVELLSLGLQKEVPTDYVPEPPQEEVEEESGPSEEELASQEEFLKKKSEYLEALKRYVSSRDSKLDAEKVFKEESGKTRQIIENYLTEFGAETEEGKGDHQVLMEGFRAHWTFTPGETYVERDEHQIAAYCREHSLFDIFKWAVDWDKWEKAKEAGIIPPDFVAQVEFPRKKSDIRKLFIEADQTIPE